MSARRTNAAGPAPAVNAGSASSARRRGASGAASARLASPWPGAACELVREDGIAKKLKPAAFLEIRVPKGGSVVLRPLPPAT